MTGLRARAIVPPFRNGEEAAVQIGLASRPRLSPRAAGFRRARALEDFVALARDADVVVLGEVHDNPRAPSQPGGDRRGAAAGGAGLRDDRRRPPRTRSTRCAREGAGREAIAEALDWADSGWPDFAAYAAILEAAPAARVFGAGQPAADVRRAAVEGAAGVFGPDAAAYGLDLPLDAGGAGARGRRSMAAAHCDALPAELLPGWSRRSASATPASPTPRSGRAR